MIQLSKCILPCSVWNYRLISVKVWESNPLKQLLYWYWTKKKRKINYAQTDIFDETKSEELEGSFFTLIISNFIHSLLHQLKYFSCVLHTHGKDYMHHRLTLIKISFIFLLFALYSIIMIHSLNWIQLVCVRMWISDEYIENVNNEKK